MVRKSPSKKTQPNSLYRSDTNRVIAGVAAGVGEYLNIDPTVIRILFLLLLMFGGSGLIIYLVLWLVIPKKSLANKSGSDTIRGNIDEMKESVKSAFQYKPGDSNKSLLAIVLVGFGLLFLFDNLSILQFDFEKLWPLLLIFLGLLILRKR